MKSRSFLDAHALRHAFVGNALGRLVDVISEQGDTLLEAAGLSFPSRASSTMLLIEERGDLSIADITRELRQPHQLVAQRIDLLAEKGLVVRMADPSDGRRKILRLSSKGKKEAVILKERLQGAAIAFDEIFDEIGVNLSEAAEAASVALKHVSLGERINALNQKPRQKKNQRATTR
ncbi:MarR family winged helix-turn-helix transcriptional regulator [Hyphococcus sp.]|uniref:MarR family winged helix-turn-helix transcriptional regulator n=1 Tax=Hyphococcus sp. TaxID=2038636 RepID=UPI0035C6FF36